MKPERHIQTFLERFGPHTQEYSYYKTLLDILVALNPPRTKVFGFGCMMMLEFTTIRLHDGREIGGDEDVMGSVGDIAEAVAILFASIERDPLWWKSRYPSELSDPQIQKAATELTSKLEQMDMVKQVVSDLG